MQGAQIKGSVTPERGEVGRWEGGTYVHLWLIHVDVWQKPM